ncbi:MAG: ZIP family metal transporter [Candidatus Aenigmarchaeota archaeon]|nr:ZIP family metal transporter [Candidatus Aenigmarchaeota archaeon]
MDYLIFALAGVTFLSTLAGGALALKNRKMLPYLFAFAAGSLIAVSMLDLLPESLSLASSINMPIRYPLIAVVVSFLVYSLLERFFLTHHHDDEHPHIMGPVGAGGLVLHSFLDGAAIGAAYQINPSIGLVVALAVIFHDFTDGVNTVTLMLKNKHSIKNSMLFLGADALAPVIGVLFTSFVSISQNWLSLLLAFFVGEFLYIGAANLLPETYKHGQAKEMMLAMGLGIGIILVLTSLV